MPPGWGLSRACTLEQMQAPRLGPRITKPAHCMHLANRLRQPQASLQTAPTSQSTTARIPEGGLPLPYAWSPFLSRAVPGPMGTGTEALGEDLRYPTLTPPPISAWSSLRSMRGSRRRETSISPLC